ncbi:MAG: 50S ribosomal protein L21 [Candidatus Colwellbacteria bacterium]|nr:50S ribosomal protein L21 [Candidatus Colwellbacteria bacterium]
MFAVIETGGKQYKVSQGDKLKVEKLEAEKDSVVFDKVLLLNDGSRFDLGTPYVKGAEVEAKILRNARERKKIVFRYHSKTRYRKFKTHRQHFTEVEIVKINA